MSRGKRIVLTAPFTEMIDHAGYFIQMGMASIPIWMEWVMDRKYPEWRNVKRFEDGSAQAAPAGLRVLERVMAQEFGADDVVVCYPDDIDDFIGPDTKIVALSTHNPLGVTFAAGVYTSIFGSSREPINSHYAKLLFDRIRANPHRGGFRVLLGGSGGLADRADQLLRTPRDRLRDRRPQRVGGGRSPSSTRPSTAPTCRSRWRSPIRRTGSRCSSRRSRRRSGWSR